MKRYLIFAAVSPLVGGFLLFACSLFFGMLRTEWQEKRSKLAT